MDCIERGDKLRIESKGVRLNKLERIVRLWLDVYAHNFKASPAVSQTGPTGTTKQVQQSQSQWRLFRRKISPLTPNARFRIALIDVRCGTN